MNKTQITGLILFLTAALGGLALDIGVIISGKLHVLSLVGLITLDLLVFLGALLYFGRRDWLDKFFRFLRKLWENLGRGYHPGITWPG